MRFNPKATLDQSQVEFRRNKEPVTHLDRKKKIRKAAQKTISKYSVKAV